MKKQESSVGPNDLDTDLDVRVTYLQELTAKHSRELEIQFERIACT